MGIVVCSTREIQAAWKEKAGELADWAIKNLYVRTDAYPEWHVSQWRCKKERLTAEHLTGHFSGLWVVGSYTVSPSNTCCYSVWDWDNHDAVAVVAAKNLAAALELYRRLESLGMYPLLEDSDGQGSYHVWVRWGAMNSEKVFRFAHWVARDVQDVEVFPKQESLEGKKYGNLLRLPGRHPKHDHWSKFWDGEKWLAGEEAVEHLLDWEETHAMRIPREAFRYFPKRERKQATPTEIDPTEPTDDYWKKQYDGKIKTLDILNLTEDRTASGGDSTWHAITCPWASDHSPDQDDLAYVVEGIDGKDPVFKCHHGHCEHRSHLRHLCEFYGKEKVDACCAEKFGTNGHDLDERIDNLFENKVKPSETVPPRKPRVVLEKWSRTKAIAREQHEDWGIRHWLEFGCLHGFTGLPFSGKSSVVSDILAAMVREQPWCDMAVTPVPFVLLDLENKERILVKRLDRALQGDEGRMEELYNRINPANLPGVPIPAKFVLECIEAVGEPKGIVVIDTMRTAFQADSNDEKEMLAVLTPLKLIAARTGWAIIVLHHNAKFTNKYSGNTAFAGVLDYLWNWVRDGYKAELSLEGRDDAVPSLCFEFDLDEQRNVFKGTKSEVAGEKKQEETNLEIYKVLKHLPDSPNGLTQSEVMVMAGVKKWSCTQLLGKAINQKCAVRVGLGGMSSPFTYYRTPIGKALVEQQDGKTLLGSIG